MRVHSVWFLGLSLAVNALGNGGFRHLFSSEYSEMSTQETIRAADGFVTTIAVEDERSNNDPLLIRKTDPAAGKTVWQTIILDIGGLRDRRRNVVEIEGGYVVAGQGSFDTSTTQILLLEKSSGKTLWKKWLEPETFEKPVEALEDPMHRTKVESIRVQDLAADKDGIWLLGYLALTAPDDKDNLTVGFITRLDPANGNSIADSTKLYGNHEAAAKLTSFAVTPASIYAVGTHLPTDSNGKETGETKPILVQFNRDFVEQRSEELRVRRGHFDQIVVDAKGDGLYISGSADGRSLISRYDDEIRQVWTRTYRTDDSIYLKSARAGGVYYALGRGGSTIELLTVGGAERTALTMNESTPGFTAQIEAELRLEGCKYGVTHTSYWARIEAFEEDGNGSFVLAGTAGGGVRCNHATYNHHSADRSWIAVRPAQGKWPTPAPVAEAHPFDGKTRWVESFIITRNTDGRKFEVRVAENGLQYSRDTVTGQVYRKPERGDWVEIR